MSHGQDVKGRERRPADTILHILQDRGKRQLPRDDVYRQLSHPALSLRSYATLSRNAGAMTPGITADTVDGRSMEKMATIIEAIRQEKWRWTPPRRVLTDKPNGGKRPLAMPLWSDKVGQDLRRSLLAASDAPPFSPHRHGCRPQRGCPTALHEGGATWTGPTWCIEGALKGGFSHSDPTSLRPLLRANLHDHRFLRRIAGALQAGDGEAWPDHPSLSGSPQGGIVRPILSNISMERCAKLVQDTLIPESTRGRRRPLSHAYRAWPRRAQSSRQTGTIERAHALRKQCPQPPSVDPHDDEDRRRRYVRYAEAVLLGEAGTRAEAPAIKEQGATCLERPLHLPLSADKTLITQARTGRARFLGSDLGTMNSPTKVAKARRRGVIVQIGFSRPEDLLEHKRKRSLRAGKAQHRAELMNESAYAISTR